MKKKSILFLLFIFLSVLMMLSTSLGSIKTQQASLAASPENGKSEIPLHAILSWKSPDLGTKNIMSRIFWRSNQKTYNSEFAKRQNDFFYFQPQERFQPDQEYYWYVEFYSNGVLAERSKVYSFRTQKTDLFRFTFSYPRSNNNNNNNSRNIWMGVPKVWEKESNDFLSVTNVIFSPKETDLYIDETGNKVVMWDTRQRYSKEYTIQADIEYVERQISPVLNQELIFGYDRSTELFQKYTKSSDFHQSNQPLIINQASAITKGITNPYKKVIELNQWVKKNIKYGDAEKDALSVIKTKLSDCAGFASLNVAFCRALGIPARMVIGVHSIKPNFYPAVFTWNGDNLPLGTHCWYEVYFEKYGWIQFESTGDLYPYDSRLTLSKNPVKINDTVFQWLHLPLTGNSGKTAEQTSPLLLKVEEIK